MISLIPDAIFVKLYFIKVHVVQVNFLTIDIINVLSQYPAFSSASSQKMTCWDKSLKFSCATFAHIIVCSECIRSLFTQYHGDCSPPSAWLGSRRVRCVWGLVTIYFFSKFQ
eukprot:UN04265